MVSKFYRQRDFKKITKQFERGTNTNAKQIRIRKEFNLNNQNVGVFTSKSSQTLMSQGLWEKLKCFNCWLLRGMKSYRRFLD